MLQGLAGAGKGQSSAPVCTGGTSVWAVSHSPLPSRPRRTLPSELIVSINAFSIPTPQTGKSTTFSWASFGVETWTEALKLRVKKTAMPKESF